MSFVRFLSLFSSNFQALSLNFFKFSVITTFHNLAGRIPPQKTLKLKKGTSTSKTDSGFTDFETLFLSCFHFSGYFQNHKFVFFYIADFLKSELWLNILNLTLKFSEFRSFQQTN